MSALATYHYLRARCCAPGCRAEGLYFGKDLRAAAGAAVDGDRWVVDVRPEGATCYCRRHAWLRLPIKLLDRGALAADGEEATT